MRSILKALIISNFLFLLQPLLSQEVSQVDIYDKSEKQNLRLAKEALRTGNTYLAIYYLDELQFSDTANLKILVPLAQAYWSTKNYVMSEITFQKIVRHPQSTKHPEALFYLALAQKALGKIDEAEKNLLAFKKVKGNASDPSLSKKYKSELAGIDFIRNQTEDSSAVSIQNLGPTINHPHIDFSPIPVGDHALIYGSYPVQKEKIYQIDENYSGPSDKRKLYFSQKKDGKWSEPGNFEGPFNSLDHDIANGCFNPDSTKFFFTKCAPNWQYKMICHIYSSELGKDGKWSEPEALPGSVNLRDYTSTHPTIGRESRKNYPVLYFSSDREGGKGGMDIWFTIYDERKQKWKSPRKAGSRINTVGDEVTPFYDLSTKKLYFSSNGHANIGGLDIYQADGETSKWSNIQWLDLGVNSAADDLDFVLKNSHRGGYFVSNRAGGRSLFHPTCCDDIYGFEFNEFIDIKLEIQLTDLNDQLLFDGAKIDVYLADSSGQLLLQTIENVDSLNTFQLQPNRNYIVEGKAKNHFRGQISFSTEGIITSTTLEKQIKLEPQPIDPIIISDIQYDFDSPQLTDRSKSIIDTTILLIFKKYPEVQFEISSHTDSKGTPAYNMRLSQKRAESVVSYLRSKGIPEIQMVAKGYGETKPIAPNTNPDGSDNPKGRQKNRRTEFRVIGEIEQEIIEVELEDPSD